MRKPGAQQQSAFDDDGWWDPDSFLHGLHTLLEPVRGPYILSALDRADAARGSHVLDIGSAGGFVASILSRGGYAVVGIDPSNAAIREATEHVEAEFAIAIGENLPFADESFGSVMCSEVLEHVENPDAAIAEISRVLRPGGVLVFSLPNRTILSKLILIWIAQRNRFSRVLPEDLHDWARFIGSIDLSNRLLRHDLNVRDIQGVSIGPRDVPAAIRALVGLHTGAISYADAGSRVRLRHSRIRAVSYMGYALKSEH